MIKFFEKINGEQYKFNRLSMISVYVFIFLVGSLIGFIYEEIFCLLWDHEIVKRGFLYGPYLPVYGFGAIVLVFFLKRFKKNPLVVFLLAMLLTGVVEYVTGFSLWQIYHKTWWDYSGLFLNIDGYVCLRSVLTFGIGGLLLIYVFEPLILKLIDFVSNKIAYCWTFLIIAIFVADFVFTLMYRNTL